MSEIKLTRWIAVAGLILLAGPSLKANSITTATLRQPDVIVTPEELAAQMMGSLANALPGNPYINSASVTVLDSNVDNNPFLRAGTSAYPTGLFGFDGLPDTLPGTIANGSHALYGAGAITFDSLRRASFPVSAPIPVTEPASIVLIATGIAFLWLMRRAHRRHSGRIWWTPISRR